MANTVKVTIDGPAGSGKTTIAKAVAGNLGFRYIDTGAMYRALAYFCKTNGVDITSEAAIADALGNIQIAVEYNNNGEQRVILGGKDITGEIRSAEISKMASDVSAFKPVRLKMVDMQRQLAANHDVIMDGRDAGSFVLPHADIKIFLIATTEDRARRRWNEMLDRGEYVKFEDVLKDIKVRDRNDCSRSFAPLVVPENAVIADTTDNTLEESIQIITDVVVERLPDVSRNKGDC
ncbi:(d)CMP kinase [Treponema sp. R6D11]